MVDKPTKEETRGCECYQHTHDQTLTKWKGKEAKTMEALSFHSFAYIGCKTVELENKQEEKQKLDHYLSIDVTCSRRQDVVPPRYSSAKTLAIKAFQQKYQGHN